MLVAGTNAVPTVYVPLIFEGVHCPVAPPNVPSAGLVTFIGKLQVDVPAVNGTVFVPAVVGVHVPFNVTVCAPVTVNIPLALNVIPWKVVVIL